MTLTHTLHKTSFKNALECFEMHYSASKTVFVDRFYATSGFNRARMKRNAADGLFTRSSYLGIETVWDIRAISGENQRNAPDSTSLTVFRSAQPTGVKPLPWKKPNGCIRPNCFSRIKSNPLRSLPHPSARPAPAYGASHAALHKLLFFLNINSNYRWIHSCVGVRITPYRFHE